MSISEQDVRHVAALARLGLQPERIPSLVAELNGILTHMDVLQRVTLPEREEDAPTATHEIPLREDVVAPGVLDADRAANAPVMRDGFFLVPRLDTHDTAGSSSTTIATGAIPLA